MNSLTSNCTQCQRNTKKKFPAERARIEAGFTLQEAARKLKLSERYLRSIERNGNASLKTARRLARLYHCAGDVFLFSPCYFAGQRGRLATESHASATRGADTQESAARRYSNKHDRVLTLVQGGEGA